jgi:twinkle protein
MAEFIPDDIDFSSYLKDTDANQKVRKAVDFLAEAKASLRNITRGKRVFLPWSKCNESFEFRDGEMTLWAGQNGHGKTEVTTQVAMSLLGQEQKVCIASFEMKPVTTLQRLTRMWARINLFAEEFRSEEGNAEADKFFDEFGEWSDGRLWFYDQFGNANQESVFGLVKYCANELGIKHIFIDSLMKVVSGSDDYNAQKQFVNTLFAIGRDYGIHIHLVHHLKKPSGGEAAIPDKHDTKGAGEITDIVDNIFMVWRNKPKEEEFKAKGKASTKQTEPDLLLMCRKQRIYLGMADGEPRITLWRDADAGNYVATQGCSSQFFGNFPHIESM